MKKLRLIILIALTVIACLGLLKWSHGSIDETIGRDFAAYWASGHILLNGDDPYSSDKILAVQKSLGWAEFDNYYSIIKEPIVIYNPPWVLTFLIPFSTLNFTPDKIIWLICMLSLMMFSADRLWPIYGGSRETRVWALIVMVTFIPGLFQYKLGQIVPLMLLGLVGFLYFIKKGKWWLAGMMTVFIAVKPHTLYLFWFALLFWAMKHRLWPVLTGSLLTLLCVAFFPLFYNPNVYSHYFNNVVTKSLDIYWLTPTLGTFLRLCLGSQYGWLQYIPTLAGLIWFIVYWRKYRNMWIWEDQLPLLILVSLMTNFYTWPSDYLMILPAIIQGAVRIYQNPGVRYLVWIGLLYIIINIFAILSTFYLGTHWWIWIPYALWINYIFAKKQLDVVRCSNLKQAEYNVS